MLDLSHLNKEQKIAVTHKNGPLLIVAGAGTGKTTVISNRVAWLIDQGLAQPEEILCLTFTDKAAGEMEERIDALLPYGYVDLWVMTFHAFCERLLKEHGLALGLSPNFTLLNTTSQWMLIQQNFDQFELDLYKPLGSPSKFISSLLSHFSRAKDESILPEEYTEHITQLEKEGIAKDVLETAGENASAIKEEWEQHLQQKKELAEAYTTYQQLFHENESLDFGDLIMYAKKLFEDRPQILAEFRSKFKYILVDEFQDTNWTQYELVKMLAGDEQNITVVGDDDQSIYKFRGASLSNILGFKKDFPKTTQVVLNTNYRSKQEILDASYKFIQENNPHRLEAQEYEGFAKIDKSLKAFHDGQGDVEHLHYKDIHDEAAGVVEKMQALKKAQPELAWDDFAILVRANSSAEPFLQQLQAAEIPFQFMASQGLFTQPVILDIVSYLKILDSYAEGTALYRILILPTIDLHNDDLMKLLHYAKRKSESLMSIIKQPELAEVSEDGKTKCANVVALVEEHARLARTAKVSEVAMAFMDNFALKQYYETVDPFEQKEVYGLLNHFWRMMKDFEKETALPTVSNFLQYTELMQKSGDSGSLPSEGDFSPEAVKVMTIHGSKGLEFEHVFVVSLVDRRFPTTERKEALPLPEGLIKDTVVGENPHLEEERRLFYVALTRAKQGLYITSAKDYGGARAKKLSRFVHELGFEEPELQTVKNAVEWGSNLKASYEKKKAAELDYTKYLPKTFSYTQMTAYERCPWQYRYKYILKVPLKGSHTQSFGVSMHKVLEEFSKLIMDSGSVPKLEILLDLYETYWIEDWYESEKQRKSRYADGKLMLEEYYEKHKDNWPKTLHTELPFSIKIGGEVFKGSIDRIDEVDGGLKIVDYKTSKVKKSIDKDQLRLYKAAAEEVLNQKVVDLAYYYLDGQDEVSLKMKDDDEEKVKEKIMKSLVALKQGDFKADPQVEKCRYCDFADICEYKL
jgi:DNA helicase-2/ATP-dependent DNA helicase PcrA